MRYFAKLDPQGTVQQVIVTDDEGFIPARDAAGRWVETWMDGGAKKNYAGIGYDLDEGRSAFIAPKPYDSWTLDENNCQWESPAGEKPDGKDEWDESSKTWKPRT